VYINYTLLALVSSLCLSPCEPTNELGFSLTCFTIRVEVYTHVGPSSYHTRVHGSLSVIPLVRNSVFSNHQNRNSRSTSFYQWEEVRCLLILRTSPIHFRRDCDCLPTCVRVLGGIKMEVAWVG